MNKYENGVKKVTIDDILRVTDEEATKKLSEELKMNRPELEEYKAFVKEGLIVPKLVQYTTDLEKYCDELESKFEIALGTAVILDEKLNYLEKALDKACEELENYSSHSYPAEYILKDSWKEWAMKDD